MYLICPKCCARHIDEGEFATKPHHTHSCQQCGLTWRPAVVPTVGVRFLPGFKNAPDTKIVTMGDLARDKIRAEIARIIGVPGGSAGCCWHVVLGDGNWERSSIEFCRREARDRAGTSYCVTNGACQELADLDATARILSRAMRRAEAYVSVLESVNHGERITPEIAKILAAGVPSSEQGTVRGMLMFSRVLAAEEHQVLMGELFRVFGIKVDSPQPTETPSD